MLLRTKQFSDLLSHSTHYIRVLGLCALASREASLQLSFITSKAQGNCQKKVHYGSENSENQKKYGVAERQSSKTQKNPWALGFKVVFEIF